MAASLSGVFSTQQFTDAGLPASGYRLYTYTAGTTTLKVAYTDAAGSIPQTYTSDGAGGQYIALNARGELPAPLYLASGSYDITLKTATGSTIWTRQADPIDSLKLDLASSASGKGAALVAYLPTTNYANGTVGSRFSDEFTTTGFSTLQAAVTAASGKTLRVIGTWNVTSAVTVSSNTTIIIEGGATVTTSTLDISIFIATNASNILIQGPGTISKTGTGTAAYVAGVRFDSCTNCHVQGIAFTGMQWAGVT